MHVPRVHITLVRALKLSKSFVAVDVIFQANEIEHFGEH